MYGNAQNQANQLQGSTALQLSGQDHSSAIQAQQIASQQAMQDRSLNSQDKWNAQNYNLGLQNSNNSFYTQNRGLDQSGYQLGANIFQNGVNGNQTIGQNQTNIGQQYYNAPGNAIDNMSKNLQPYTGYNNSVNQQNGSGSKAGQWIGGLTAGAGLLNAAGGTQGISNWWNNGSTPATTAGANMSPDPSITTNWWNS